MQLHQKWHYDLLCQTFPSSYSTTKVSDKTSLLHKIEKETGSVNKSQGCNF